jgi:hypothetical protein
MEADAVFARRETLPIRLDAPADTGPIGRGRRMRITL